MVVLARDIGSSQLAGLVTKGLAESPSLRLDICQISACAKRWPISDRLANGEEPLIFAAAWQLRFRDATFGATTHCHASRAPSDDGTSLVCASLSFRALVVEASGAKPMRMLSAVVVDHFGLLCCSGYVDYQLLEQGAPVIRPEIGPLRLHPVPLLRVLSRRQLKVAGGSGLASARLICTGHGGSMYLLVSQVLWSRALPLSGRPWAKTGQTMHFACVRIAVNTGSVVV